MMIQYINIQNEQEAELIWQLQHASYIVEAEMIGFSEIPPLMDTIRSLQQCGETFYGWFAEDELVGAVSYTKDKETVTICRMMVHPDHFRKGIAGKLLKQVEDRERDAKLFKVSTGTKNTPAVKLYQRYGYVENSITEAAPGVFLTLFLKKK